MKKYFISILSLFFILTACSSNKDKDLFDSASQMYKANNYTGAVTEYQKLVEQYPDSKYAEESYFALAGIYQMGKIPNVSKDDASKRAVGFYQEFYSKFPNSDKTPKALFMIGFIRANDLNDFDSARIAYNEFLQKFPKSDLVPSVKLELDNLGKTPDQILQENKSAVK